MMRCTTIYDMWHCIDMLHEFKIPHRQIQECHTLKLIRKMRIVARAGSVN